MGRAVTIYDIAYELKVSPATVSRALRDHQNVSKKTKTKIKLLALERGYKPNAFAVNLGKAKRSVIGIIVPHLNSPPFSTIVSAIEQTASKMGFTVNVAQSFNELQTEMQLSKYMLHTGVSGLVVWSVTQSTGKHHFDDFLKKNIPVVFLDSALVGHGSKMVINYFNAGYLATSHLLDQGCRRIVFIGGTANSIRHSEILAGYRDAMESHEVKVNESWISTHEILSLSEGYAIAKRLLTFHQLPDAIIVDNDEAIAGVLRYTIETGIKIPEQLAVLGFNSDPVFMKYNPQISTVTFPANEMGTLAVHEIAEQVKKQQALTKTVVVEPTLELRQSSQKKLVPLFRQTG